MLAQLVAKLPPILRSQWANVSSSILGRLPNIIDFNGSLDFVAMAETSHTQPCPEKNRIPSSRAPPVFTTTADKPTSSCLACAQQHGLYRHDTFFALDPDKRAALVHESKCCYRYLDITLTSALNAIGRRSAASEGVKNLTANYRMMHLDYTPTTIKAHHRQTRLWLNQNSTQQPGNPKINE